MSSEELFSNFKDEYERHHFLVTCVELASFFITLLFFPVRHSVYFFHLCYIFGAILMLFLQIVCELPNRPEMDCLLNEQLKVVCIFFMSYAVLFFHIHFKRFLWKKFAQRTYIQYILNFNGYSPLMILALVCCSVSFCLAFSLRCESYTKECSCNINLVKYNLGKIIRLSLVMMSSLYCIMFLLYTFYFMEILISKEYLSYPFDPSFIFICFLWLVFHAVISLSSLNLFSRYSNVHDYSDFLKMYAIILWVSLVLATPSEDQLEMLAMRPLEMSPMSPKLLEYTSDDAQCDVRQPSMAAYLSVPRARRDTMDQSESTNILFNPRMGDLRSIGGGSFSMGSFSINPYEKTRDNSEKCSSKCTHTDSESIRGSTQDFEPNDHVRFLDDTFEDVQERENAKAHWKNLYKYSDSLQSQQGTSSSTISSVSTQDEITVVEASMDSVSFV